jgi:hypothetical protein
MPDAIENNNNNTITWYEDALDIFEKRIITRITDENNNIPFNTCA